MRIAFFALGIFAGVVITLSLRREPTTDTAWREPDDGVQPVDPYLARICGLDCYRCKAQEAMR